MLRHISIRDFAIVETAELEFSPGFTALTGETGAGKSILIDALALALGDRADALQVRDSAGRAEVSAEFSLENVPEIRSWLEEQALEGDADRLLLRRIVERGGRTRAFINGRPATLAQLRETGERLVDIHGQHAHHLLLRPDAQRQLLDAHAGLDGLAEEVARVYRSWQQFARARVDFEAFSAARNQEREDVASRVADLTRLAPIEGEWEKVTAEHARHSHAASLLEGAETALQALAEADSAALAGVSAALTRLRALTAYDTALSEPVGLLESAEAQIQEAARVLRRYSEKVDLDPQRLTQVSQRLEALHSAARRFRVDPGALHDLLSRLQARLAELQEAADLDALVRQERQAEAQYRDHSQKLTQGRKKAAARLAREVSSGLKELAMKDARLEVSLVPGPPCGGVHGDETVEFLFAPTTGTEARPLSRVASGGELSRISLAIQVVTSKAAAVPTLIFDEVDSGIGGAVAEVVGRRLRNLGSGRQVLCVTHLAQVAAQANEQWQVSRANADKRGAGSRVQVLSDSERVEEIARMLGGVEITATTRRHAAEMLGMREAR